MYKPGLKKERYSQKYHIYEVQTFFCGNFVVISQIVSVMW